VAEEDKPALYRLAVALVFPSLYEGFGMMLLEAMQAGTPVITSDR
jgi:glycosyltransferase involved in cell wall biosynthesis